MVKKYFTRKRSGGKRALYKLRKSNLQKKGGVINETYVFIIHYRARHPQEKRREQLIAALNSIKEAFTKYKKQYRIIVVEQNNDLPFNTGLLKNIGFLEGEKLYNMPKVYLHFNVDYLIDKTMEFPKELEAFDGNGVLDICAHDKTEHDHVFEGIVVKLVGGCCCFNAKSFKNINGLPNKMFGYSFEDAVFRLRVDRLKVPYIRNTITNNGWIQTKDETPRNLNEMDSMYPIFKYERDVAPENYKVDGLSSCKYVISGVGEFNNDGKNIKHILADFKMDNL
jgi:hypothetical protein